MAAVETGQAIITALWTRITSDATMKSVMGDHVSLYRVMGPADPSMPYFWHRLALNGDMFHSTHSYFLDLWYYGVDSAVPDQAIDRAKILLHEWRFTTANDEAGGLLSWFSGGYIPTDVSNVWHYAMQFDARFVAGRDVTNIT